MAAAEHPRVLVSSGDRDKMRRDLKEHAWMRAAYAEMRARVDPYVERHKTDPDWILSRMPMNWETHYTVDLTEKEKWVRGEGRAPVPTPRFAGGRDWASPYSLGPIDQLKPRNDKNGLIWAQNKKTGEWDWVNPGLTGMSIESVHNRMMDLAADAGFIYWLTGDEAYAKFGSDILWAYCDGQAYKEPPRKAAGEPYVTIGVSSFEVIHESLTGPLGLSYDFLHDYLVKQGKDVKRIQIVLKTFADRIMLGGNRVGNWNLFQGRCILGAALPLEDDDAYPDKRGRQFYANAVLTIDTPTQLGIKQVIAENYGKTTGLWPEAFGYGATVTETIMNSLAVLGRAGFGEGLTSDGTLKRSAILQFELLYPDGWSNGVGDTNVSRALPAPLEMLIADARRRGDTATEDQLTGLLRREIDAGFYDRSKLRGLLPLCLYVPELKNVTPPPGPPNSRLFYFDEYNVVMQRNYGPDVPSSLAASLYGTRGGHVHANGMAIELHGAGLPLAPDTGRGSSYWQPDHGQYYSRMPAHNTVIVNGKSDYAVGRKDTTPPAMDVRACEPASGATPVSPNFSFVQGDFAMDKPAAVQRRLLAVVRMSESGGFFFDVFRSRATDPAKQFHDYVYHGLGQSMQLTHGDGRSPLALSPSAALSDTKNLQAGYRYFQQEQSAATAGDVRGVVKADLPADQSAAMNFWMLGANGRTVFQVAAPTARSLVQYPIPKTLFESPMPTFIVRQQGDAWARPFVTLYEPSRQAVGPQVERVESLAKDAAAEFVAVRVAGGASATITLLADDAAKPREADGITFTGTFGAVTRRNGRVDELYLGKGQALGSGEVQIGAPGSEPVSASLRRDKDRWLCSATAPVRITIAGTVRDMPAGSDQPVAK